MKISPSEIPAAEGKLPPSQKKVWRRRVVVCVVLILIGALPVYWYMALQTYHLATVQNGVLYRDGNRDLREFKHALKFSQARTVVSLVDDQEMHDPNKPQFVQELDYCTAHAIQYIRLPVKLGGWPSSDDLQTFIPIAKNPLNQPVLVHCAQGVRRTGMFVAAYQESVLHESPEQAKNEILSFKHKAEDLDDVRKFIDLYVPSEMTLPTTMPASGHE